LWKSSGESFSFLAPSLSKGAFIAPRLSKGEALYLIAEKKRGNAAL
jgi:hypothetical protein